MKGNSATKKQIFKQKRTQTKSGVQIDKIRKREKIKKKLKK